MKKIKNNGDTNGEEYVIVGYKMVTVFDVSQTEGNPLIQLKKPLTGSVIQYDKLFKALSSLTEYHIRFSDNLGSPNELCCFNTKEIILKANMSQEQTIKTLIHEIAHATIHCNSSLYRAAKEIQAESVAFILCNVRNIDSPEYSFLYIATWGGVIMEFMSAREAADKWGISQRRVAVLCSENRIEDAKMVGNMWIIPTTAVKPIDARSIRYIRNDEKKVKPFLKWAGGKGQLLIEKNIILQSVNVLMI